MVAALASVAALVLVVVGVPVLVLVRPARVRCGRVRGLALLVVVNPRDVSAQAVEHRVNFV
jgi:hypothetical protein